MPKGKQEKKKPTTTPDRTYAPVLKNISTGIGFLLNPALEELLALSSLPSSLTDGVTLPLLPLRLTPWPWPYPMTTTSDSLLTCLNRFEGDSGVGGALPWEPFLDPRPFTRMGAPVKYDLSFAEGPRWGCSSRIELRVDELHLERRVLCTSCAMEGSTPVVNISASVG